MKREGERERVRDIERERERKSEREKKEQTDRQTDRPTETEREGEQHRHHAINQWPRLVRSTWKLGELHTEANPCEFSGGKNAALTLIYIY